MKKNYILQKFKLDNYLNYNDYVKLPIVVQTFSMMSLKYFSREGNNVKLPLVALNGW